MMGTSSLRARLTAHVGALAIDAELDTAVGTLVLVGPNGAGKTSLLSLLLGVLPVERGHIEIGDAVLLDTARSIDVPAEARRLGYVPQQYGLFPHLSVRENVAFAVKSANPRHDAATARAEVDAALRHLGISTLSERRTHALSGGEKQRVALARALSVKPRALLMDEPLAALDIHSRREVRAFLADSLARLSLPTIVVTHDPVDARILGRRIAVLEAGHITQVGSWDELASAPASRFVQALVASAHD